MEILRLLTCCIFRQHPRTLSSLESLPNEILQHINVFLPLPAAVAFAFCSHRLYFVLGNSSWKNLVRTEDQVERERKCKDKSISYDMDDYLEPPAQGEREELILLLERDLPRLIFCQQCALLHGSNYDQKTTWNRMCALSNFVIPMVHVIHFMKIQMTMKLYRLGLEYGRSLKEFSVHDIYPSYENPYRSGPHSACETREARIVGGKFLVRIQSWMILPIEPKEIPRAWRRTIDVCAHISTHSMSDGSLSDMFYCRISHLKQQDLNCPKCSGLRQCPFCETEYQIDSREVGTRGYTIVLTRWWNLGPGLSPYDTEFKSHFVSPILYSYCPPKVAFRSGSIKGSFEGVYSIDSLLEKYLCGRVLTLNNSKFYYEGKRA